MDLLLQNEIRPFLIAGLIVLGLLVLEFALVMFGLSGGIAQDGPELETGDIESDFAGMNATDIAAELEIEPELAARIETGLAEADTGLEPAASNSEVPDGAVTSPIGTVMDLLGLRKLPFSVSLALFLACFASVGTAAQILLHAMLGYMLPVWLIGPIALICAAFLTRKLVRFILYLVPRDESSAISERSLGKRIGIVTVGTASAGNPAQIRVTDGYGNTHYTMVEPLSPEDTIPEGSEVLVMRIRGGGFRILRLE